MKLWPLRMTATVVLGASLAMPLPAQKADFSADMKLVGNAGRNEIVKLYLGGKRLRLDGNSAGSNRIGSVILDFDRQSVFLLIPESKMYLRIAASSGMPFYQTAWMFRPNSPDQPCGQWISEAEKHGVTLRCKGAGEENVNDRITQKWEGTSPQGVHLTLWYEPGLNFIVKIVRTSKNGLQSGYELENIKLGPQPQDLFNFYSTYREFSVNKLLDGLTGIGEW